MADLIVSRHQAVLHQISIKEKSCAILSTDLLFELAENLTKLAK